MASTIRKQKWKGFLLLYCNKLAKVLDKCIEHQLFTWLRACRMASVTSDSLLSCGL